MTDRYQKIRDALSQNPTPGPRKWWENDDGYCCVNPRDGGLWIAKCDVRDPFDPEQRANAALIAACDPDTIRALLKERDELAKDAARYRCLSAMATQQADSLGPIFRIDVRRSESCLFDFDAAVDTAMQQGEQQ